MIGEVLAMGTQGGEAAGGAGGMMGLLPFILIIVILYLLIIRPQQKRHKEQQMMINSLKKGDRVVTTGGVYGTIVSIKDDIVVLRIARNVDIELSKQAISGVVTGRRREKE